MATTLFLRHANSDLQGAGQKMLATVRGAAVRTAVTTATVSGTNISVTQTAGGQVLTWFTQKLAAGATISGTITPNIRGLESVATVNGGAGILIERCNAAGVVQATISSSIVTATEWVTTESARTVGITPTLTAMSAGERIKITMTLRNVGTMAAGTATYFYDGPTAAATGDTFVTFTENLTFETWTAPTVVGTPQQLATAAPGARAFSAETPALGDWLLVQIDVEAGGTDNTCTATGLTFTLVNTITGASPSSKNELFQYVAREPTGGIARTVNIGAGALLRYTARLTVLRGSNGPGAIAATETGQAVSFSRAAANSRIQYNIGDWTAGAVVTPTWIPAGGVTTYTEQDATHATHYYGSWSDSGAVAAPTLHGFSTPAVTTPSIAVLEMYGGVSATTQVSKDLDIRWRTFARVTKDLDIRWRTFAQITKDLSILWKTYVPVAAKDLDIRWKTYAQVAPKDLDLRWRTMAQVVKDLDLRWKTYVPVAAKDLDIRWKTYVKVAPKDLDIRWRTLVQVQKDLDLRWRTLAQVQKDLDLRWRTYARVPAKDLDLRWRTLAQVQKDLDLRWKTYVQVQKDLDLRWKTYVSVAPKDLDLQWRTFAQVVKDLDLRWKTLSSAIQVVKDLDLRWRTFAQVPKDLDLRWKTYARVAPKDLDLRWKTYVKVAPKDLDLRWKTYVQVQKDVDIRWRTLVRVAAKDLDIRWRTLAQVQKDLDLRWRTLARVTKDLDLRWKTYVRVPAKDLDLRWKTYVRVPAKNLDLRWRSYAQVAVDFELLWRTDALGSIRTEPVVTVEVGVNVFEYDSIPASLRETEVQPTLTVNRVPASDWIVNR